MHHFQYRDGVMHAEDVALDRLAASVGTPFYCYSTATLARHYQVFTAAFDGLDISVRYALKANSNLAVVRTLAGLGAGADVVSEGELRIARLAGVPANKIVFSGVGKTAAELALALDIGIDQFNVESEAELAALSALASSRGKIAPIAIRINPAVDSGTHAKIATGGEDTKFGIPMERARAVYAAAAKLPGIAVVGAAVHIGSQLTTLAPFETAFRRLAEFAGVLRADGHDIRRVDLGGGLGIPYDDDADVPPLPRAYGDMVRRVVGNLGCTVIFEPGRLLVGNAGILVTRVIYLKQARTRTFAIVDAAMNDLLRPALYDAYHRVMPVKEAAKGAKMTVVDVAGPVCETGDVLAVDRPLPPLGAGDLLAIMSAGAYGAVMSSTYNARPLPAEVLVNGAQAAIVRRRPSASDMLQYETVPDWLAEPRT
jgi:diaminopimelate decarboxylase